MSTARVNPRRTVLERFFAKHVRFVVAFAFGLCAIGASLPIKAPIEVRALLGANVFFLSYLWLVARMALSPAALRARAREEDEGAVMIVLVAALAFATALTAILRLINDTKTSTTMGNGLALLAVPLGWIMIHTLVSFHYSHLYYRPKDEGDAAPGLTFPNTTEPGLWDFLYFSFCVGMAAQVSDVVVETTPMRRLVLIHALGSFFTNTVILALTVNAAASL